MEKPESKIIDLPVEWRISEKLVAYDEAIEAMEARVKEIYEGEKPELIWFLEHPPLYTAGSSAKDEDLLDARFPVFKTGRGGQYTYHGDGQRIAYIMLDLRKRGRDLRAYICKLEEWIIKSIADFGIIGERRDGRVGIWVDLEPYGMTGKEAKIAAIGVRVRKWVTYHGVAINLNPNLEHFKGIVPCGIKDAGVTSFEALGVDIDMKKLDESLKYHWAEVFG